LYIIISKHAIKLTPRGHFQNYGSNDLSELIPTIHQGSAVYTSVTWHNHEIINTNS